MHCEHVNLRFNIDTLFLNGGLLHPKKLLIFLDTYIFLFLEQKGDKVPDIKKALFKLLQLVSLSEALCCLFWQRHRDANVFFLYYDLLFSNVFF
jgi:hypothetical protein